MRWLGIPLFILSLFLLGMVFLSSNGHCAAIQAVIFTFAVLVGITSLVIIGESKNWKTYTAYLVVILAVLGLVLGAVNLVPALRYQDVLASWKNDRDNLAAHFPRALPKDAKDVFIAEGSNWSDRSILQLTYSASNEHIKALEQKYSKQAKRIYDGTGSWISSGYFRPNHGRPYVKFYGPGSARPDELPKDYKVILLQQDGVDNSGTVAGHACGIAISAKRGRVIYWAARWFIS